MSYIFSTTFHSASENSIFILYYDKSFFFFKKYLLFGNKQENVALYYPIFQPKSWLKKERITSVINPIHSLSNTFPSYLSEHCQSY